MTNLYQKFMQLPSYYFWPLLFVVWALIIILAGGYGWPSYIFSFFWGAVVSWYFICPRIFSDHRCDQ